jgi:hypothetical protein
MATFDQRGQSVNYQYNAAENINLDSVQNKMQLVEEIEKLKSELFKASDAQAIDAEVFTDADYQVDKAIQLAKKSEPDKKSIVDRLKKARTILEDVATVGGLVTAINKLIQLVSGIL